MDHKALITEYRQRISGAENRVFDLEGQLADCKDELNRFKTGHITASQDAIKTETGQSPQDVVETLANRLAELERANGAYRSWMNDLERITGVKAADLADKLSLLQQQVTTAADIEIALRKQVTNYEKSIVKAKATTTKSKEDLAEAQAKTRKLEANLWRAANLKQVEIRHLCNAAEYVLTCIRNIPTPPIDFTTKKAPLKRKASALDIADKGLDEDDEEINVKLPPKVVQTPTSQIMPKMRYTKRVQEGVYGRHR
ncbi:hypothetical protein B0A50_06887 [Salinomyces thailandicus]|uniref:Uncharacterized protein n=1 Tax=Salinomyces thailandicus TaxID=706561 RepID=A0A4U0TQ63_9PEZI|nr:hypothetical protein B0A50_06887 [Salinomyces thailandica]